MLSLPDTVGISRVCYMSDVAFFVFGLESSLAVQFPTMFLGLVRCYFPVNGNFNEKFSTFVDKDG